jgi:hypothetical protein
MNALQGLSLRRKAMPLEEALTPPGRMRYLLNIVFPHKISHPGAHRVASS